MPYIGHAPTQAGSFVLLDDLEGTGTGSFNGSTVTFNLKVGSVSVSPKASSLIVSLDGVIQQSPSSYTTSGSTIVFTEAPASGMEFYGMLMGQSSSIGAGTITLADMAANSVDSDQYVDLSIDNAHVATGLDAVKIADGSVTNAELQYINSLSSNAQTQITAKAPIASPTFTGTPLAPTASASTNTTQLATTAFVRTEVTNLIDSAPSALDTLNELAAALGDDASFSTTVTNSIATKLPLAGGTLTGSITQSDGNHILSKNGNQYLLKQTGGDLRIKHEVSGSGNIVFEVADGGTSHTMANDGSVTFGGAISSGNITGSGYLNLSGGYGEANSLYMNGNSVLQRTDSTTLKCIMPTFEATGISLSQSTANSYGLNAYHSSGNTTSSAHIIRGDSGSSTKAILDVHEEATRSNLGTNVFLVSSTSSDTELFNVTADGNATVNGTMTTAGVARTMVIDPTIYSKNNVYGTDDSRVGMQDDHQTIPLLPGHTITSVLIPTATNREVFSWNWELCKHDEYSTEVVVSSGSTGNLGTLHGGGNPWVTMDVTDYTIENEQRVYFRISSVTYSGGTYGYMYNWRVHYTTPTGM